LQDVDGLVTDPKRRAMAVELMQKSDAWGGLLARMGGRMAMQMGEEKAGVDSNMAKSLNFLRTPAISAVTRTSSFKLELKKKKQTIYLVCPPELRMAMRGWIRAMIDTFYKSVLREGLGEDRKVHFILDEAAALGSNMDSLEDAIAMGRGYGIRLQFFYQSAGQLLPCWPKDGGQTLRSNCAAVYIGANDYQTAKEVSERLGQQTVIVEGWNSGENRGSNDGTSTDHTRSSQSIGSNKGHSSGQSLNQQARALLNPDEILNLPPRTAIGFPGGGTPPLCTRVVPYFEMPSLYKPRNGSGLKVFLLSIRTLIFSVILALLIGACFLSLGVGGIGEQFIK